MILPINHIQNRGRRQIKAVFGDKLHSQDNLLTRENQSITFLLRRGCQSHLATKCWWFTIISIKSYFWPADTRMGEELTVAQKELEEETGIKEYQLIYDGIFAFWYFAGECPTKRDNLSKPIITSTQPICFHGFRKSGPCRWRRMRTVVGRDRGYDLDQAVTEKEMFLLSRNLSDLKPHVFDQSCFRRCNT